MPSLLMIEQAFAILAWAALYHADAFDDCFDDDRARWRFRAFYFHFSKHAYCNYSPIISITPAQPSYQFHCRAMPFAGNAIIKDFAR